MTRDDHRELFVHYFKIHIVTLLEVLRKTKKGVDLHILFSGRAYSRIDPPIERSSKALPLELNARQYDSL
jgi:hypothetical protein